MFFCFLIVLAVCLKVFTFRAGVLDELWPYDLSRAITMGYVPYKDYPIVSMPLFGYVFAIPLLISRTLNNSNFLLCDARCDVFPH